MSQDHLVNLQRVQGQGSPRVMLWVSPGLKVEPAAVLELTQAVPQARREQRLPQLSPGAARSPRLAHFLPAADDGAPGHGLIGILCFTGDAKGRRIKIV